MYSAAVVSLLFASYLTVLSAVTLSRQSNAYNFTAVLPSASALSDTHLKKIYNHFVVNYIVDNGKNSVRVRSPSVFNSSALIAAHATSSEGMGLAMLATAFAGDKARFNKLFTFYNHARLLEDRKIMPWLVWSNGTAVSSASCTPGCRPTHGSKRLPHADIDVCMALLIASARWGDRGLKYKRVAVGLLNHISKFWLKKCHGRKSPSYGMWVLRHELRSFHPCRSQISPWSYKPAFFTHFATVKGVRSKRKWIELARSSYRLFDRKKVQDKMFIPDKLRLNSSSTVPNSDFSYPSARIPWSLALDYAWRGTPQAKQFSSALINDLVLSANNNTLAGIQGPIDRMTGNSKRGARGNPLSFHAGFAAAAMIAGVNNTVDPFATIFRKTALSSPSKRGGRTDAYGMAMAALAALALSGNARHPAALAAERSAKRTAEVVRGEEICEDRRRFGFLTLRVRVNRTASIAELLNRADKGRNGVVELSFLQDHFKDIDKKIQEMNGRDVNRRDCELDQKTLKSARKFVRYYGWGELAASSCVTKFPMAAPDFEPDKLFARMSGLVRMLNDSTFKRPLNGFFNNTGDAKRSVYATGMYRHKERYRVCDLVATTGYRVAGGQRWAVWRAFTNAPARENMARRKRLLLSEALYVDSGEVRAQEIALPRCRRTGTRLELARVEHGTTLRSEWDGKNDWQAFGNAATAKNPAVVAALENGEHEMQLALDSNTASNTAILVLPMLLAAVPLALFADVSAAITVAYSIVTDVVSVLPVLIKGIELLYFGRKETFAAQALVYGAQNATDVGVTESWVAKCRIVPYVSRNGIILVVVAIVGMVLGISLELVARRQVERNKEAERRARARDAADEIILPQFEDNYVTWTKDGHFRARKICGSDQPPRALRGGLLWAMSQRRATEEERVLREKYGPLRHDHF